MGTKSAVVLVILAVFVANWITNLNQFMSLPAGYITNDKDCTLHGLGKNMIGSEDMALGEHGILFITSGDLWNTFKTGVVSANPGGIWILDMRENGNPEPVRLELRKFPSKRLFQPHGLDVSNSTNRLYAISHNGDHSSVDIFTIEYRTKCASLPWSCAPVTLTFIHSVTSHHFPNSGINDVVEASDNEIYVTQWQPFSFPEKGQNNAGSILEKLQGASLLPIIMAGIRLTSVFHCRWSVGETDSCKMATKERFIGANGITISDDGSTVFVNDPANKLISIMERNKETGFLTQKGSIPLQSAADNIEFEDQTGDIIISTIPNLKAASEHSGIPVPGGMSIARLNSEGVWNVASVLEHDGTKLSQISGAARLGRRIALGSPYSEGILLCTT